MRISSLAGLFAATAAAAGCSGDPNEAGSMAAGDDSRIACALGDDTAFEAQCDVERVQTGGRRELVIRHPDGGFRRFEIVSDGRGLVVADGSEQALIMPLSDGRIQLSVGSDRYRLPATIKRGANGG